MIAEMVQFVVAMSSCKAGQNRSRSLALKIGSIALACSVNVFRTSRATSEGKPTLHISPAGAP